MIHRLACTNTRTWPHWNAGLCEHNARPALSWSQRTSLGALSCRSANLSAELPSTKHMQVKMVDCLAC